MDLRQGWRLAMRAVNAWSSDYAPSMGAALSYYALFSIAPLLLIVIGVAGFFFGDEAARGGLFGELSGLIGADGARAVEGLVANARKPESGILAMASGMALTTSGRYSSRRRLEMKIGRVSWTDCPFS